LSQRTTLFMSRSHSSSRTGPSAKSFVKRDPEAIAEVAREMCLRRVARVDRERRAFSAVVRRKLERDRRASCRENPFRRFAGQALHALGEARASHVELARPCRNVHRQPEPRNRPVGVDASVIDRPCRERNRLGGGLRARDVGKVGVRGARLDREHPFDERPVRSEGQIEESLIGWKLDRVPGAEDTQVVRWSGDDAASLDEPRLSTRPGRHDGTEHRLAPHLDPRDAARGRLGHDVRGDRFHGDRPCEGM
jgi:hypothetical protein